MSGSLNANGSASATITGPSGDLTVCGWFRVNLWTGLEWQLMIYVSPTGGDGDLGFEADTGIGSLLAYFWDGTGGESSESAQPHPDSEPTGWVFGACSINGTTGKVRILRSLEGAFETYTHDLTPWAAGTRDITIFSDKYDEQAGDINGRCPRIFTGELTDEQLLAEARSPTPVLTPWAAYSFDAVSGWEQDATANNRDLTTTGTPVYSADEPPDISDGGGDTELPVGLSTETDSALALTHTKFRSVGLAEETDTALQPGPTKTSSVGLATETNTALAPSRTKLRTVGLSGETDAALALSQAIPGLPIKLFVVGSSVAAGYITMSGGDPVYSPYALGRALGLTTYFPTVEIVDTAVEGVDASWLQLVYESQVHAHFDPEKRNIIIFWEWLNSLWAGGTGDPPDPAGDPATVLAEGEAYALNAQADGFEVLAGTCTPGSYESEEANLNAFDELLRESTVFDGIIDFSTIETLYPPGWIANPDRFEDDIHLKDLGQQEVTAFAAAYLTDYFGEVPTEDIELPVGLATEINEAIARVVNKQIAVAMAAETAESLALEFVKTRAVGLALETNTALTVQRTKYQLTGLAEEVDRAHSPLDLSQYLSVGLATETNTALALSRRRARPIGTADEVDIALSLVGSKVWAIGLAVENDEALSLFAPRVYRRAPPERTFSRVCRYVIHDPDAVLDYTVDLAEELADQAIDTVLDVSATGLTLGTGDRAPNHDDTSVTFWAVATNADKATVRVRVRDNHDPPRTLNDFTCIFRVTET